MAAGAVIAIAAAAALALAASGKKATKKTKGPVVTPVDKPKIDDELAKACDFEADMPPPLRSLATQLLTLADKGKKTADDLEIGAAMLDKDGFPKAAECLRKKAAELRQKRELEAVARGGMPFVIRQGDIPINVVKAYAPNGDTSFSRLQELGQLNAAILGAWQSLPGGIQGWPGWKPNVEILIPLPWDPLNKPPPPLPVSGGGKPVPPTGGLEASEIDGWAST